MATDMRLSNAKTKTWSRCHKQFEFKYEMGLRPKSRGVALQRGSWLHDLLMVHSDGEDWEAKHRELTKAFNKLFEEEREDLGDLPSECERIMRSYLLTYRKDEGRYRTVDTELDEIITLPNGLRFQFIIDKIYEDTKTGLLWLKDYKTVSNFMDPEFMLLDAQLTRYFWCAEYMGYTPLAGVEFDEIRTKPPTVPAVLKNGHLTEKKNLGTDFYTYLRAIKSLGQDPMDYANTLRRLKAQEDKWFRRTRLPKDKPVTHTMMAELVMKAREIRYAQETGNFPRSENKSCTWDCDYLDLCTTQLQGGDLKPLIRHRYMKKERKEED